MKILFVYVVLILSLEKAIAADDKLKHIGLMLVTGNKYSPDALNEELQGSNISDQKSSLGYLGEYSIPFADLVYGGLRFANSLGLSDEGSTFRNSKVSVTTMGVILRLPIINTKILTVDGIAEAGLITTGRVSITESFSETKYETNSGEYQRLGGAVGIGYESFFLYAETGVESNKFRGFTKTGNRTGDLPAVDLSGTYTAFGIKFAPSLLAEYIKK